MRACDAVMLIGFGGPTAPSEIRPFLDGVLRGRPVPRERYEEVVRHYEEIGGRSPYNDLTMRQARTLRARFQRDGVEVPVVVGMRNWTPSILEALSTLTAMDVRTVFGFVLAAHRCEASWERYLGAVAEAAGVLGGSAPEVVYADPWHSHPGFIRAVADRTRDALAALDSAARADAKIIFTAHSVPVAMAAESGYTEQITESSRLVAAELGVDNWTLAFQSRSGSPHDTWLEPDIGASLRKLGRRTAVVVPIGFLCDHVEVLYDLDIEAAKVARESGVRMVRAATVGNHPEFIGMIASMARPQVRF
ncbi:MAG: ferrochelatase [Candidatus Binataceae bacterium]